MKQLIATTVFFCTTSYAAVPTIPHVVEEEPVSKTIDISSPRHITISGGYKVKISKGDPKITVSGLQETIDDLIVKQTSGTLMLSPKKLEKGWFTRLFDWRETDSEQYSIAINVFVPNLNELTLFGNTSSVVTDDLHLQKIELSGATQLDIRNKQSSRQLNIDLRGTSTLSALELNMTNLEINLFGSSDFEALNITAKNELRLHTHASSKYLLGSLKSENINIDNNSASSGKIGSISSDNTAIRLFGASTVGIGTLNTNFVRFDVNSSSEITVKSGASKKTQLHIRGNGKTDFNDFQPGQLEKV